MVQASLPGEGSGTGSASFDHGGVGGYILAGLILFGGLGMWMDRWLGLSFLTPLGLVLGAVAGGYLVYLRVVRVPGEPVKGAHDVSGAGSSPDSGTGTGTGTWREGESR